MYFLSYEWLSRKMNAESLSGAAGAAAVLTAGGMAGTASWFVSYPIDVIKSRLQVNLDWQITLYFESGDED